MDNVGEIFLKFSDGFRISLLGKAGGERVLKLVNNGKLLVHDNCNSNIF